MKATKFDQKFDAGKSVMDQLDLAKARRANVEIKRVNVDFPQWMVHSLDRHARRLGITRQSLIKIWLTEKLEQR
ncbi:MAG: type II toxin-antitoxin system BrnA family antitoxin [Steroidobacteraceae bacterium]